MNTLIEKIKTQNCSESFLELKRQVGDMHSSIYHKLVKFSELTDVEKENFLDSVDSFIMECVNSYDCKKGMKFSTYYYNMARFKALNLMNKRKSIRAESFSSTNLDEFENDEFNAMKSYFGNFNFQESEKKIDFFSLVDTITTSGTLENEMETLIFDCRMHGDKKSEIVKRVSETFNCSPQTAYVKIKNLNKKLKSYE